jgi:hypothetical protein
MSISLHFPAFRIKFRLVIGISLAGLAQFISTPRLSADESPLASLGGPEKSTYSEAFLNNFSGTSAVDAKGVRHRGVDYPGIHPAWQHDMIKAVAPNYPDRDRILRHKGEGLFRLTLDLKTGSVTKVTVIKTTGFPALDASAVTSLRIHLTIHSRRFADSCSPTFCTLSTPSRIWRSRWGNGSSIPASRNFCSMAKLRSLR